MSVSPRHKSPGWWEWWGMRFCPPCLLLYSVPAAPGICQSSHSYQSLSCICVDRMTGHLERNTWCALEWECGNSREEAETVIGWDVLLRPHCRPGLLMAHGQNVAHNIMLRCLREYFKWFNVFDSFQDRVSNRFWKPLSYLFMEVCTALLNHFVLKEMLKIATPYFNIWIYFSYYCQCFEFFCTYCIEKSIGKIMRIIIHILHFFV